MNIMRFTIIDPQGNVSFIADCDALAALVAACAKDPQTLDEALSLASDYYPSLRDYVLSGLAVFDEHNGEGNYDNIHAAFRVLSPVDVPVFRVADEETRQMSLQPIKAGAVLFNLPKKRIVQLQNSYREIRRKDRVRLQHALPGKSNVVRYELPSDWSLVP